MTKKLIAYQLNGKNRDYSEVQKYIKSFNNRAKVMKSVWFVETNKTTKEIRNELMEILLNKDYILVVDANATIAWSGLPSDVSEWIKD